MAYSTIDDLKSAFDKNLLDQLADDENDGTQVDAKIEAAIGRADVEIDGYLTGRYSVPLNPVPPKIKTISIDLAIVELFKRRTDFILDTKSIKERKKEAINDLLLIQKGVISLTGTGEPNKARVSAREKTYSSDFLSKY